MGPDESSTLCKVPMKHTSTIPEDVQYARSTHEGVQYSWSTFHSFAIYQKSLMGMAVVLHMRVCSTCEAHPQYLKDTPEVSMRVWAVPLRVLWVCLKGTAHAHKYIYRTVARFFALRLAKNVFPEISA